MPDAEDAGALNAPDDPDASLVARAISGDAAAFTALVRRHQASVFRLARAMSRSHAAAEDVLQQTFLSAWQALPRFRGEASVRTWLLTIARHAAWHQAADAARLPVDDTSLEDIDTLGCRAGWGAERRDGDNPETLAIEAERRQRVALVLERLDPGDRAILTLRELEGLSGEETAALLGLSLAGMKSRLHRARLRLAAELRTMENQRC